MSPFFALSAGALLVLFTAPVFATSAVRLASSPIPAAPGQEFTLCAANVGNHKTEVTLKFVNVRTGVVVAEKTVQLAVAGAQSLAVEPCLSATTETVAAAGTQPSVLAAASEQPVVVGFVTSRAGLGEHSVTASVQIRAAGSPQTEETIPLMPSGPVSAPHNQVVFVPRPK